MACPVSNKHRFTEKIEPQISIIVIKSLNLLNWLCLGMKKSHPIKSGIPVLDDALDGGIIAGELLHIVGPGGVGKTTLALQFALDVIRKGDRVFYVNLESSFPIIRFRQLSSTAFARVSPLITVVSPKDFHEQVQLVRNLDTYITPEVKLLVFDTIVSHYRKEWSQNINNVVINRMLNQQFGLLANFQESHSVAIIVINQVRSDINGEDEFKPVAESIISYWANHSIQISRAESKGYREFKLLKHKETKPIVFTLELLELGFK